MKYAAMAAVLSGCGLIAACGGGSSGGVFNFGTPPAPTGGGGSAGSPGPGNGLNTVPVLVDTGPAGAGGTVNSLYTTVTVCMPGSATVCQAVDHVLVDTGSTGFRILAAALGGGVTPAQLPQSSDAGGHPLDECNQFADGFSWGTVRGADLKIGSESAPGIPIQVIGDTTAPAAPASCVSGPEENTLATLGANGILGIGNFLSDCGMACESSAVSGSYYDCAAGAACTPVAVSVAQQVQNPVSFFTADNNGIVLTLPGAPAAAATLSGTLTFGIGTQSDNGLGNAQIYTVDPSYGALTTLYKGISFGSSFLDSGADGYFFTDDTIATCTDQLTFYCPPSALALSAIIQGTNGTMASVAFSVDNADTDLATNDAVLPNLAGPNSSGNTFAWGLSFYYGRTVFVAFENGSAGGVPGPWVAF